MGYEEWEEVTVTRQVVIGGKNKYMINGRTAQQSQVANLFHSVQLNVNNPHFLIMQASSTDHRIEWVPLLLLGICVVVVYCQFESRIYLLNFFLTTCCERLYCCTAVFCVFKRTFQPPAFEVLLY